MKPGRVLRIKEQQLQAAAGHAEGSYQPQEPQRRIGWRLDSAKTRPAALAKSHETLVEPWWNPRGTLPQGRPRPPRSLSGLRPQSVQLLGKKKKKKHMPSPNKIEMGGGAQE